MGPTGQAGARTAPVDGSGHRHQSQSEEEEVLIKIEAVFSGRFRYAGPAFSAMRKSAGDLCAAAKASLSSLRRQAELCWGGAPERGNFARSLVHSEVPQSPVEYF